MRYSTKAWIGLVAYIVVAEIKAPKDDMLSHAYDTWLQHPVGKILAPAVTLVTAAHLLNYLEEAYDPYHLLFFARKKGSGKTIENGMYGTQ